MTALMVVVYSSLFVSSHVVLYVLVRRDRRESYLLVVKSQRLDKHTSLACTTTQHTGGS